MVIVASVAHFTNDVSVLLLPTVLPLVIEDFGLSYATAGLAVALLFLLESFSQIAAGYMADRVNKLVLLIAGLVILGMATLLVSLSANYIQLLIFQCLLGIGASFYHPIGYSLLSDTCEVRERGKALGLVSAAGDAAAPVAFLTSGLLAPAFGWRMIFVLWSCVVFIVAFTILFITGAQYRKREETYIIGKSARKTMLKLMPVMVIMLLAETSYLMISSFSTSFLTSLGVNIELANITVAVMMAMGILGEITSGFLIDRFGERITILGLYLLLVVTSAVTFLADKIPVLILTICIMGFPLLGVWPAFYSYIAKVTSESFMAFIYGTVLAVTWGGGSLTPYIGGVIADFFGLKLVYSVVAALSLVAIVITNFKFKI